MPTIYQIIYIVLITAFIILWSMKTEYRYKVRDFFDIQFNRTGKKYFKLISDMLDCDFCLSFWVSLVIAALIAIITFDFSWLLIPFMSTPLIRFLL
jgi:hypothetical protein